MSTDSAIIFDCQIFQTAAWHRGMGKYTLSLLGELFTSGELRQYRKLILFNSNLILTSERRKVVEAALPGAEIVFVNLPIEQPKEHPVIQRKETKRLLTDFIYQNLAGFQVEFVLCSLFTFDYVAAFPDNAHNSLIFYDLIPYLRWEYYRRYFPSNVYYGHYGTIFEADRIFTISQTVADDLVRSLGVSASKITNINGAHIDRVESATKKPNIGLDQKYILLPTGDLPHKNNLRAVQAFASFNATHNHEYKLVVTSFMSEDTQQLIQNYSTDVIFSGNVSEAELDWLFAHTELVLFASDIEGLGIPILEAVQQNKRIACSDIPVFREMSDSAFYYFDPTDIEAIERAINLAIDGTDWKEKMSNYATLRGRYTWEKSASAFVRGLALTAPVITINPDKPRLAIICPNPSSGNRLGQFIQYLFPALANVAQVEYYLDGARKVAGIHPDYLSFVGQAFDAQDFGRSAYRRYDAVLYVVDDTDYSLEAVRNGLVLPGFGLMDASTIEGTFRKLEELNYLTSDMLVLEQQLGDALAPGRHGYMVSWVNNQRGLVAVNRTISDKLEHLTIEPQPLVTLELPSENPVSDRRFEPQAYAQDLVTFIQNNQ
jgi:glycosyltransferase involved in cell wall biosynthesis